MSETEMRSSGKLVLPKHPRRAFPPFMHGPIRMACKDAGDPDAFTEEGTTRAGRERTERAKAVCRMCPLRATCAEWATETEQLGVWGATTTAERKKIRKYRKEGGGCLH